MKIVSITEILHCNERIREKDLKFKIHLRDACGKQSCWIESLDDQNSREQWGELYQALEEYFAGLRFQLEYGKDKTVFWLQ